MRALIHTYSASPVTRQFHSDSDTHTIGTPNMECDAHNPPQVPHTPLHH